MKFGLLGAVALLLTLVGCGGGGTTTAGGGTGGTGVSIASSGTVSAVGSIWVNGIEYDTTNATVVLADGSTFIDVTGSAGGTLLKEGMVVTLTGSHVGVAGQATRVVYSRSLLAPISAVLGNSLTVLGQTVMVDTLSGYTRLEPATGWTPAVGDWVEVSGFGELGGLFHASYLKHASSQSSAELLGTVTALNANTSTFTLNGVSHVRPPQGYSLNNLALGDVVRVTVNPAAAASAIDPLLAQVAPTLLGATLAGDAGEEGEVEGVVLAAPDANGEFVLNGQRVVVGAGTLYQGGLAGDLVAGVKVEAEGSLSADGRLQAATIKFEDPVEIEARIALYDATTASFTLAGISSAVRVYVDPVLTEAEAGLVLADNQPVKLRGRLIGTSTSLILASQIKPGDASRAQLQGTLESVSGTSSFSLLDTTIPVSPTMTFDLHDQLVSASVFFGQVTAGQLIKVDGTYNNGAGIDWTGVELEQ